MPPSSAPSTLVVQQGNGQVLLNWSAVLTATSYTVERSTDLSTWSVLSGSPALLTYLDTTPTAGTQYFYRVAGVNINGTGPYRVSEAIVPTHPGEMTLGQVRQLSKERADRVNSRFVTDSEWNVYINQSYFELYDLLVQKYGNDYFVESAQFTTNGGNQYTLPNGVNYSASRPFYKLMGVDLGISPPANAWLTLKKFEFAARNRYVYPQITTNLLGVGGMRYRLVGGNLEFIPTPSAGQTIRLWYIPRMVTLLQDSDLVDGVSGWTEYIVIDAAIKALAKEESDTSVLQLAKQAMIARIEAAAENRDAGMPETVSSTGRTSGVWGWGDSGDNGGPTGGV